MISASRIIALFAAFAWLAACGLKGPLYLPKDDPVVQAEEAEQPKPATNTGQSQKKPAAAPTSP
jgi:predicted small lipoprotein YifL